MLVETSPLVSVITPAHNCASFILETVESVLRQDYPDIEYIVIDDGSTDGTQDMLAGYYLRTKDKRLVIGRMDTNIGEQKTVNEGLGKVEGKYFMIVNADDPLLPDAICNLVDFMETHPDVLCAYPDWDAINEDGAFRTHIKSREYDFIYMVKHHTCLPSVGSMFRSDIIKKLGPRDTSFRWLGDFDYWLRVGIAGEMARVPSSLATWRHRNGQASRDKNDRRAREHIRLIEKFYSLPALPNGILRVKPEAICWSYLVAASVSKSRRNALCYILIGLIHYPRILLRLEFYDTLIRRAYYILRR